jgi:DNA segregation ATPase FtsK/SpoIIIE, S-DNA-T family
MKIMSRKAQSNKNTFKEDKASEKPRKKISFSFPPERRERIVKIIGLLFLFFSFFMFVSFVSFLFSWKYDQSLVNDFNAFIQSFQKVRPDLAKNAMGVSGAYIAHLFIARWFGIASFLFIGIFFLTGFRLLFSKNLFPFFRTLITLLFFIFWSSAFLGFLFHNSIDLLGGAFGVQSQFLLRGIMGSFGTFLFLILIFLVYLVLALNISFKIPSWFHKVKEEIQTESSPDADLVSENIQESEGVDESEEDGSIELIINNKEQDEELEKTDIANASVSFEVEKAEPEEDDRDYKKVENQYDPTLDLSNYKYPPLELLNDYEEKDFSVSQSELEERKNLIIQTLRNYAIEIERIKATVGPTVTLYEIIPVAGIRISKIKNLEDDIALSLSALGIRIIAPIPGKGTIGIEVPNTKPEIVSIKAVLSSSKFQNTDMELPFAIGKTIANEVFVADLTKMPHLLIAGATGQGKSVGLNTIIASFLYKKHPSQVKFVMVDPKKVELSLFQKIENHFLARLPEADASIITDVSQVVETLNSLTAEMDQRYLLLKDAQTRNIKEYNAKFLNRKLNPEQGHRFLPYIVLIIDELADLMMTAGKEVELPIARLAQLARAIGIHLIIATQRPSVNIITGTIKANFPARVAFKVSAAVDSRTILDSKGAEQLIGRGDMLFSTGSDLIRMQCAFIDTPEVESLVDFISDQQSYGDPFRLPEVKKEQEGELSEADLMADLDPLFEDAARIIVQHQQGSTSLLQRRLKLGYNRAGRLIDQLESAGVVGPFEGSKARSVLISDEYSLEQFLKDFMDSKDN